MAVDTPRVLVVDDEPNICRTCVKILGKMQIDAHYALNGFDALQRMDAESFAVVITDLKMSRLGGMEVIRRVHERHPDTLVIVITGFSTVSSAVEVMKMGAFDYLPKPFTPHELRAVVRQALTERENRLQNRRLMADRPRQKRISHRLVGDSRQIRKVVGMIGKVAPTDSTVLVYGESGTGKELVARAVHANSNRKDRVFFAVDCGTLPKDLLENELFGHKKGAFTGAHQDKDGIFTAADGGTVFLDEIGNVSTETQGKLLRFLEARELLPLGASTAVRVDVRLIFATNQNLEKMVADGSFREDFYYRIYVYPILLPPLRDRQEDILPIAYHFLAQFAKQMGKSITGFTDRAANRLKTFQWPGNVRQLRNVVERAVILCESDPIDLAEMPALRTPDDISDLMDHIPGTNEELKALKKAIRQKAVVKVERNFLVHALMESDWNITRAAAAVRLQRTNFQALMKKHKLNRPKS